MGRYKMLKKKTVDALTGEEIIEDLTAEEIAIVEAAQAEAEIKNQAHVQKEAEKAAVLAKLGLTAEEAAALLS